jgi:TonB family protein
MTWWHYLLLVNFYLVIFFGFYVLLLRTETFFQLNRIYLVAASLLSFLIPLIQANWVQDLFITRQVQQTIYSMPVGAVYNFTVKATADDSGITLGQVINALYITVTLFLIIRLGWQLLVLKKAIEKPSPSAAYSFFKKISLGENISPSSVIAEHEQVHAGQWHSVDVMIIETVMIINWFNPVVYLYRFAIKYIHEFIADRQVIQAGTDKADYAMLLLSQTFQVETHNLVTPFYNHSLLKKRIMMLQKNKSQRIALAKYGLSAPLFILMMIFSSATINNSKAVAVINNHTQKVLSTPAADVMNDVANKAGITATNYIHIAGDIVPEIRPDTVSNASVFGQVEQQPTFPGGLGGFIDYLAANVKYPAADRSAKLEGKVDVGFIVETNGRLSNIKALNGPSETMKAEAISAVAASPKWDPGKQNDQPVRVSYTVPVYFSLSGTKPIYSLVEAQPRFPGGLEALGRFFAINIQYPAADKENGVSGKVVLTFAVERDGSVSDIKALSGPSEAMKDEAIRVLLRSPKWRPGVINNKLVRTAYTVPVQFTLSGLVDGSITTDRKDIVFSEVDKQPQFPGGLSGFARFLTTNIKYPAVDKANKTEGKVIASFVVESDGTLSDIKAMRGPSETLKAEAVRVLLRSPKWVPGVQNGHAVRVAYTLPIQFTIPGPPDGKIYSEVTKQPQFQGGIEGFGKFISTNIRYPNEDRKNNISGRVICSFIVEADGTLTDIKALRSPSDAMAKEAVRVLKLSPKWQPGLADNKYVRTTFTVPINFNLSQQPNTNAVDKVREHVAAGGGKVYDMIDKQPSFPGGIQAFGKFLGNSIRYPKEDREKGISGRVICSFVVETDGTLSDVKALRGPSETLKAEAVRVLLRSPKWQPGTTKDGQAVRVTFTVPISFTIERANDQTAKEASADSLLKSKNTPTSPLYIVDGEVVKIPDGVSPLTALKQEDIASMEILKEETATKLYGERGKNGVILITTVKGKKTPAKP